MPGAYQKPPCAVWVQGYAFRSLSLARPDSWQFKWPLPFSLSPAPGLLLSSQKKLKKISLKRFFVLLGKKSKNFKIFPY